MYSQPSTIQRQLFDFFSQHDRHTVYSLVSNILVAWGWESVEEGVGLRGEPEIWKAKRPAEAFWHKLTHMSFEGPYDQGNREEINLDQRQIEIESQKWGSRLAKLSFEETIEGFALAVHDWLLCCLGKRETILDFCKNWGADLGVD